VNATSSLENSTDKAPGNTNKRFLVPVDFSEDAKEILKYAMTSASRLDAVVVLLHVIQLNIQGEERGIPRGHLIRNLSASAKKNLCKLVALLWNEEVITTITIREGRIDEEIVREAVDSTADMIIIGSRHRDNRWRFWKGNTAARVLRKAPCPVLVVPLGRNGA